MSNDIQIDQSVIDSYVMPHAPAGMVVMWYPQGIIDRARQQVAYMLHCGARTAQLYSPMAGRRLDVVRHIDDPKLRISPEQRENGAWDFTEGFKEDMRFREWVLSRLAELGQSGGEPVDSPKKTKAPSAVGSSLKEYHALRRKLRDLGMEAPFGSTKEDLEAKLASAAPVES